MTEEPVDGPATDRWTAVIEDMEATAAEYREAGWEVVEVHPGDVTLLPGQEADRFGVDVLAPDDEADAVADVAADATFGEASVYRAVAADVVYVVVAVEDPDAGVAVLVPAYYDARSRRTRDTLDRARQEGEMRIHVRNLQGDPTTSFVHDDPGLFEPPEGTGDDGETAGDDERADDDGE